MTEKKSCLNCVHCESEDGVQYCWKKSRVISDSYGEGDDTPCTDLAEPPKRWAIEILETIPF